MRKEGASGSLVAEVTAPAKLTLSLRVTGVRPDGYHLLDAEMVAVDLADTLYFSDGDGLEVVDAGASAGGHGEVPTDGSNLVRKALSLVGRKAHVRLVKRIPAGAGLGGGSADAAAVLRWAGATGTAGLEMAAELGSDVPFCFAGGARARVRGTGEILEPLRVEDVANVTYTLLVPPFGVATAAVYQAWDVMGGPSPTISTTSSRRLSGWSRVWRAGGTDWETRQGNVRCSQVAVRHGSFLARTPGGPGCRPGFAG